MSQACVVTIRRGAIYFTGAVYERYFDTLDNVILLRDGCDLLVLPVRHQAAGGFIIKLRSKAGDRTIMAAEFFRANGIEDDIEMTIPAMWSEPQAALVASGVFT